MRIWFVMWLCCASYALSANAQQANRSGAPPAVIVAQLQGNPDEQGFADRKFQYVTLNEPYEMVLFRADPRLFEQRFVAILRFQYPEPKSLSGLPQELRNLWAFPSGARGFSLLSSGTTMSSFKFIRDYFDELANHIPAQKRPNKETLEALSGDAVHLQFEVVQGGFEFRVMAPTEARCKELTDALLTLLDDGLARRSVVAVRNVIRAQQAELAAQTKKGQVVFERLDVLNKQLEDPPEVSREALVSLMTQQHLLQVDWAGVKARVEAAQEFLSRRDRLTPSRIEQVENIKITAEIDLAGLAARRRTLQQIVDKGKQRSQLVNEHIKVSGEYNRSRKIARRIEGRISTYTATTEMVGALPLQENKVVIRPLRWKEQERR